MGLCFPFDSEYSAHRRPSFLMATIAGWIAPLALFALVQNASAATPRAEWVSADEIRLSTSLNTQLLRQPEFLLVSRKGLSVERLPLNPTPDSRSPSWRLTVPSLTRAQLLSLIKKDLSLEIRDAARRASDEPPLDTTGIRLTGVLDKFSDLNQPLGCETQAATPTIRCRLWSPAARNVELLIFDRADLPSTSPSERLAMTQQDGTWEIDIEKRHVDHFYLYAVTVFWPDSMREETHFTTDPWSHSLSANGLKSQFVDLESPSLLPPGWSQVQLWSQSRPPVIYETHLRDASALEAVPLNQGRYRAISDTTSLFHQHLKRLAEAGLTHLHLLPVFDFGSVPELRSDWSTAVIPSGLARDSFTPQEAIGKVRLQDGYNWGYDPVHLMVPEGSYATDPNGAARILEFRQMVKTLSGLGLGLVLDVVFNHTYQSGREPLSVFDKIAPYYFYRTSATGQVEQSSCCADTASERPMVERWLVDSVVHWTKHYKVSGFRFDLMSFHTRSNMKRVREKLDQLSIAEDGVDGRSVILFGEGWTFGSLVDREPNEAMTQINAFGLGVGTFNDRIRDALRGGTPHSSEKSDQGWATGLYWDFNHEPANQNTPTAIDEQRDKLGHLSDVIKAGLIGNLADYRFNDHLGNSVLARDIQFRGQRLGYAATTVETVNYASAHDGYTLWDSLNAKLPFYTPGRAPATATSAERASVQRLILATVLVSQGFTFIEGGSEMLRSKGGDQDSYDSGDWFNSLDFTLSSDRWGMGLPPAWKNGGDVSFWAPRLKSIPSPSPADRSDTLSFVESMLRLRARLPHFSLLTPADIQKHLRFYPDQERDHPGLIVFSIDSPRSILDPKLVIALNPSLERVAIRSPFADRPHRLAPELGGSTASTPVETLSIGARSIGVWEVQ